ncbi:MAG: hypothetical protein R3B13_29565 [Polyangiaceae bacterium]
MESELAKTVDDVARRTRLGLGAVVVRAARCAVERSWRILWMPTHPTDSVRRWHS